MPYAFETLPEDAFPYKREYDTFLLPLLGAGRLAGEFPDGITTVEGVPVSAEVRILLRRVTGQAGDGAIVAVVQSAADGTWEVTGLPMGFKYDVVARLAGQNDVIMSDITPMV